MSVYSCRAPAKINLTLTITGQRDDGYHLMDSMVVFADLTDIITITIAAHDQLSISGPYADCFDKVSVDENIIMKAIRAFRAKTGWSEKFSVTLEKVIPVAAGIGGGSSNAAAILKLLNTICPQSLAEDDLHRLGQELGADVPVCLKAYDHHLWRMRGIGERLDRLDYSSSSDLGLILINPGAAVPTRSIFQSFQETSALRELKHEHDRPQVLAESDVINWLQDGNDLTESAMRFSSKIGEGIDRVAALRNCNGYLSAGMSGSGATVFALFEKKADALAAASKLDTAFWHWAGGVFMGNE